MIAWLLVGMWNLLALVVMFGPVFWVIGRWEKADQARERLAVAHGLPPQKNAPRVTALRWGIGLGLFLVFGYLASIMYEASGALHGAMNSRAAL